MYRVILRGKNKPDQEIGTIPENEELPGVGEQFRGYTVIDINHCCRQIIVE